MTLTVDYTEEVEAESTDDTESDSEANTNDTEDSSETTTQAVDKELVLYVGNVNETDGNYYVRLGDSSELHGISQASLETLLNGKAFDYWKTSIDSMTISDLDHLDVTYQGTTYTLKRVVTEEKVEKDKSEDTDNDADDDTDADSEDADDEEETKTVTTYYVNDQEADSDNFTASTGQQQLWYARAVWKKIRQKMMRNLHFLITERTEVRLQSPIRQEIPVFM